MTDSKHIVVISGPSGAGKTTLVNLLLANTSLPMRRAITCTTRKPREGERHAVDYYFASEQEFRKGVRHGDFVATAFVHGNYYGTPVTEIDDDGIILLIVDVQGFRQIKHRYCNEILSFFIVTSEYRNRLIRRNSEDEEEIGIRLRAAEEELKSMSEYDYVINNDDITEAFAEMNSIIIDKQK